MVATLVVGTNTYIELADATIYMDNLLYGTSWAFLDADTQNRALLSAFLVIEKQAWDGAKTDPDQEAQFPRTGLTDKNSVAVDSATVPYQVENGQCELALLMSLDEDLATSGGQGNDKKRLAAGSASIEYFRPSGGPGGVGGQRFPPTVQEWLGQFLSGGSSAITVPYVSGVDVDATAVTDDVNAYGLTGPF